MTRCRRARILATAALVAVGVADWDVRSAGAVANPVITVTSNADSGEGTLRAAITTANSTSGADTIQFAIPDCTASNLALSTTLNAAASATATPCATKPSTRSET